MRVIAVMRYRRCPCTAPKTEPSGAARPNYSCSTLLTELREVNFKAEMMMLMRPVDEPKEWNSC